MAPTAATSHGSRIILSARARDRDAQGRSSDRQSGGIDIYAEIVCSRPTALPRARQHDQKDRGELPSQVAVKSGAQMVCGDSDRRHQA